ncbi:unnamed protein product [Parnassius apollo]|uniref:(apollo) hypothetical protein n=1 Tax=Parnassius apollo TaxID=110799 RepID=A0A8S3W1C3_PARAO|nr:unnamed protein product [Parnassius apollo]
MLRHSLVLIKQPVILLPQEKEKCSRIAYFVIVQCILVFVGSATIHLCVWSPENSTDDYDKLARIMYLYDSDACGYELSSSLAISNLKFSNDTHGFNVLPIKWQPAIVTVSTRFSAKTRRYIELSIAVHHIWILSAIILRIFVGTKSTIRFVRFCLSIFFYVSISVVIFDLSMAIVYAAHIKKSLTKGMILRYSGWSVEMKLKNYDDFGGWIPVIAAVCWMRGIFIMFINIYCCRTLHLMIRGIRKREVKRRLTLSENSPLPEARTENPSDETVLYYRTGEFVPYVDNKRRI